MGETATVHLILIHESELRLAAAALDKCLEAQNTDAFPRLACDALDACIAALHGISKNPDAALMLTATDNLLRKPKGKRSKP